MQIFAPKRDENEEWRKLHNAELHSSYRSHNIAKIMKSRRLRWAIHVARMEKVRSALNFLTGKPIGKIALGRPRLGPENSIRMNFIEISINTWTWVDLTPGRDY
jgi:hypothetical protein